ncbi:GspH/FimT family pseudopilin [Colwellia psychrerythraea]|uniref:Type II secretion system protein H n=1 Tax=Colwellia psychrerythraea TaxID=28229 RepID=A0A099KMZ3_COLPS|nr:GspH/FimT family pseudopilin [Colwellia psychrerythraea]KGJ91851.1 General secretion pathway, GspH [Colwellia psychrerythraea]
MRYISLNLNKTEHGCPTIPTVLTYKKHVFSKKRNIGFSLIELMITVAIGAIAVTIAIPSLSSFTAKMRVDNEVSELQRLLLTTRNAAINSGQNASLCSLQANDTCQNINNWAGRVGVVSIDGLIREREAIQAGDRLQFAFNSVTYNPSGQLSNNNIGLFTYCPRGLTDYSRGIDLSLSGRPYLSSDNNGDGKDQDRNNNNIVCN